MERVISYVDGFNLYFGLKSSGWRRYYWLNIKELAKNLLADNQILISTKYFTTRVSFPPDKQKRQSNFIEALYTLSDLEIFYGNYQSNLHICRKCGFSDYVPNEKMTDVNIAVELLADAFQNKFDVALLLSADSDLTAPILAIKRLFPEKKVVVAFPPNRSSKHLKRIASGYLTIDRRQIAKSQFPTEVRKVDGFVIKRPHQWK